ncbi:MAG: Ig-like domain-containing protein [Planctomycetota bacterium]
MIGVVETSDGRWLPTDATWRVFAGDPPRDAAGRRWTEPDYDDRSWPLATVLGRSGCGPWDRLAKELKAADHALRLDRATRAAVTTDGNEEDAAWLNLPPIHREMLERATGRTLPIKTAYWIWAGPGIDASPGIAIRKVFGGSAGGAAVAPTSPQALRAVAVDPTGFTIRWEPSFAPQGVQGYEVAWNGLVIKTVNEPVARIDGLAINPRAQNYAWVRAVTSDGMRSARSDFVLIKTKDEEPPRPPSGLRVVRVFHDGFSITWQPAEDNVGVESYSLSVGDIVWTVPGSVTDVTIRKAKYYAPDRVYPIKLTARDDSFQRSSPVTISSRTAERPVSAASAQGNRSVVLPPDPNPIGRFAVVVSTDGKLDRLRASLADAEQADCEFVLAKGQIVPQLSSDPAHWDAVAAVVNACPIPVILSPLSTKDQWSGDRYDMMTARTGRPINHLHQAFGGQLWLAALCENPRGNPGFLPNLEMWVHSAERQSNCRWLFTSGMTPEAFPSGVPEIILQLHRPTVDIMRMINGDRGHELAWEQESNVACVCPQRNRSGGHFLVNVEEDRLVFVARQQSDDGRIENRGIMELHYDRASNRIEPTICRVPHPGGMAVGLPNRVENGPAWTQNRFAGTRPGRPTSIKLLGRSPRGAPLQFQIVREPAHGRLETSGATVIYTPDPNFVGEDWFLYQADDGGPWPANTAWAKIRVGN